jgi:hypothetical protein
MADPNTNMGEAILQGRPLDIPVSAESDIAALQNELTRVRNERDRERNERDQERNERAQDQAELSMLRRIVAQRQRQDIEVAGGMPFHYFPRSIDRITDWFHSTP